MATYFPPVVTEGIAPHPFAGDRDGPCTSCGDPLWTHDEPDASEVA
ncbi:MAG: hypothetical protein JWM87_772 [Candidatus Eremiobacteraeota bacterium]|nr:hypothetical protein [Candidatus Eremiobacteraeota bacterium]